jgi:uncharacterized protein (DUF3084 family)
VKLAVLIGLIATLAIANGFFFFQLDGLKQEMSKTKDSILIEIAKDRQVSAVSTVASKQSLEALRTELETARRHTATVAGSVRKDAAKHANQLAERLQEEQRKQQEQVNTELSQVKEATGTANQKITDVSVDVGNVRTEVAATKSELDKTIAELRSVHGDLGVQSGLIATNAKELTALRTLGERNYFEFDLAKAKQPYRIGDVSLTLKKSDTKRNRYTVEVLADDKRVEKKDKTANEPVQFYVSGARLPYEIVVNEVKKDRIVGYLATPKLLQSRKG